MGNNLFGANISGKIARALGPQLPSGQLLKTVEGSRDPNNLAAGVTNAATTHKFQGIRIGLSALRKDTIIPDAKDAVMILGDTVKPAAVPVQGDRVVVEKTTFVIVGISRDPDAATYTCQVK